MKLWKLTGRADYWEGLLCNPWNTRDDTHFGFVITANTAERARQLASYNAGDEGKEAWLNPEFSFCVELVVSDYKGEQIVIADYKNT